MHFSRERLVLRRNSLNLSQEALAEKAKLSKRSIVAWESGDSSPTTSKLEQLATALDVSSAWLLGADDSPSSSSTLRDDPARHESVRLALRALRAQARALVDQIEFYERELCDRVPPGSPSRHKPAGGRPVNSGPPSDAAPLAESAGETYDQERHSKS